MINLSLHQSKPESAVYNHSIATEKEMSLTVFVIDVFRINENSTQNMLKAFDL
jgi:hypothetical protein